MAIGALSLGFLAPVRGLCQGAEAGPSLPLDLRYEPREGCPGRDEVKAALLSRGLRTREPLRGEVAPRLTLEVAAGEGTSGALSLLLPRGDETRREITGDSCRDVVLSLSLVASLALSPIAAELAQAPAKRPPPEAPPPAPAPTPAAPTPRGEWWVSALVGVMTELGPRTSPGLGLSAERGWGRGSLRAALSYWPHGSVDAAPFEAAFTGYLARVDACALSANEGVRVSACGGLSTGALRAEGTEASATRASTRAWVAPTVSVRALAGVAGPFRLELAAGLFAPLVRESFVFDTPRVEVHRPGAIGVEASLSLGVSIW